MKITKLQQGNVLLDTWYYTAVEGADILGLKQFTLDEIEEITLDEDGGKIGFSLMLIIIAIFNVIAICIL